MAIVKIKQIHTTLKKALEYIDAPEKTNDGLYTTSNCGIASIPESVYHGMRDTHLQAQARHVRGRRGTVLAHHIIHSFLPGEVTPERAHELGVEFVHEILGDDDAYDYIIATHVDRGHVHNHIIFNPVNRHTFTRYRMHKKRVYEYRAISNKITAREGLSITREYSEAYQPKKSRSLADVYSTARGVNGKQHLQQAIDYAISSATQWADFETLLDQIGIEVTTKGRSLVFNAPKLMKYPIRASRLGDAFTEAALRARIGREDVHEFTIQGFMIRPLPHGRIRIQLPGTHPSRFITTEADYVMNHGSHYRAFIPTSLTFQPTNSRGRLAGEPLASGDLYTYFSKPADQYISTPAHQPLATGRSAAQQRYNAYVDHEIDKIHVQAAITNSYAHAITTHDENAYDTVAASISDLRSRIRTAIIDRQTLIDHGQPTTRIDADIAAMRTQLNINKKVLTRLDTPPSHTLPPITPSRHTRRHRR